jgi:hypothetical protein
MAGWNVRPEHPHWPLVWLTLVSQAAVGVSLTATTAGARVLAAILAGAALAGAPLHLGRPAVAYKTLRNLRRSWLSREVALLGAYGLLALAVIAVPALRVPSAIVGVAGVYASARLYVVPGRPAWNSPLTVVRFFARVGSISILFSTIDFFLSFQCLDNRVQRLEACAPEMVVPLDPRCRFLQSTHAERAGPHAPDLLRGDESRLFQDAHVLLHSRERHVKLLGKIRDRRVCTS